MHENGKPPELPTLHVVYDPLKQAVGIQFEATDFKTWDFVLAILDMAKMKAQTQQKMAQVAMLQQAAAMQQQDAEVTRKILRGN